MYDVTIIGAGPAGLTAGIYAGRGGLKTLILDTAQIGGTVNNAPLIENYPGFVEITGQELTDKISRQAKKYSEIREFTEVDGIVSSDDSTFKIETEDEIIDTKNIILATGTTVKTLDAKGIEEFRGRGISYCAVCDGNFFVNREVLIVGGGNSAAVEALYLNKIGVKCSLVHRRDQLRCDAKLQEDLARNNIPIIWNSEVVEVKGNAKVEKAVLYDNKKQTESEVDVDGIFISIGHLPNNKLAVDCDVECDESGYIVVDKYMKTSEDGIYAVGDITGCIKQIAVATGQGAIAASDIQSKLI